MTFTTPEWVHHAVFYQIFPDRFASSPQIVKPHNLEAWDTPPTTFGFKGGDLQGVTDHLDYLQDLGINAIYFTPIFQSAANHRYHTHDYLHVDPILGGDKAFQRLLKEAHSRGIRIVLDGVFNHASRGFFQFNHILENGAASPYIDWFTVKGYPLHAYEGEPNYNAWVGLAALPQFNHANPQVRDYIYHVARYWLDQGIDGWRLDVPFCVDDDAFWQGFREVVKGANPEAYITGEIPWDARRWLQGDQFDGVMNYLMSYACWGFFGGPGIDRKMVGHWYGHGPEYFQTSAEGFAEKVEGLLTFYPRPAVLAQLNLLDSHDTARAVNIFNGNKVALRLATAFQMTYPGAPSVYYGDEIGLPGGLDPDCRRAFPWNEQAWDTEQRAWFRDLIHLRSQHRALRDGDYLTLYAKNGVVATLRRWENESLVVAINNSPETQHLVIPVMGALADGCDMKALFGSGAAHVQAGRLEGLTLAPRSAVVLG